MPTHHDEAIQAVLDRLLREHRLAPDTALYREAVRGDLTPTAAPGVFRLPANASPRESVIDVYGQGHLVQAEQVGPGIAFAETPSRDWQETMEMRVLKAGPGTSGAPAVDRIEVGVLVQDILAQGGLLYPVESVTVERAWYCTLPQGSVSVREVSG